MIKFDKTYSTPNVSSRGRYKIDWITVHYTGGLSGKRAAKWLCNPEAKASAHFVVDFDGTIYQLAPLEERTWHVGRGQFFSNGKLLTNRCDRSAVGIELANPGMVFQSSTGSWGYYIGRKEFRYDSSTYGEPQRAILKYADGHVLDGYWAPFSQKQLVALLDLCTYLCKSKKIDFSRIVGHESVATPLGRKSDPGPLFPWEYLYKGLESKGLKSRLGSFHSEIFKNHRVRSS